MVALALRYAKECARHHNFVRARLAILPTAGFRKSLVLTTTTLVPPNLQACAGTDGQRD